MPDDHDDDLSPDIARHLHDAARALDGAAAPVSVSEVVDRAPVAGPRRRVRGSWSAAPTTSRRSGALVGAAAAALLLGLVFGFAAGRGSAPAPHATVAAAPKALAPASASTSFGEVQSASGTSTATGEIPYKSLGVRTTAEGVVLRLFLLEQPSGAADQGACPPDTFCPPASCYSNTTASGEISTDAMAAVAYGAAGNPGAVGDVLSVSPSYLGAPEGDPVSASIVQVSDRVVEVTATFDDGSTDRAAPQGGWALLAHRTGSTEIPAIAATLADGSTVSWDWHAPLSTPAAECLPPPPTLPAAGAVQPADVDAAKAAVTQAYLDSFSHDVSQEVQAAAVEDPAEVAAAKQAMQDGPYSDVRSTINVSIGDIVFTSDTEAYLFFTLSYDGTTPGIGQQIGHAKLIDGRWVVAKDTMCNLLSMAGSPCGGSSPMPTTTVSR